MPKRRKFLVQLATLTGGTVLFAQLIIPASAQDQPQDKLNALLDVPLTKPADWDPIEFNRLRGNAGAIPETYLADINGPEGDKKYLGQHLPYIPKIQPALVPKGFVALMWGNPAKGYTRHPAAPPDPSRKFEGHWFNWIRIRKAVAGEIQEIESTYTNWPKTNPSDTGSYAVFGGGNITADEGKNTLYLAALPKDVVPGDMVRIWAHCLLHGEYVDFITL
jgi:hypothetical protein